MLPFPFDSTPVGVTAGVALLSWALYRAKFVEIVPVASHAVVERTSDAVAILDDGDRVVDWNGAAGELSDAVDASAGVAAEEFFESVYPTERLGLTAAYRDCRDRLAELTDRDGG